MKMSNKKRVQTGAFYTPKIWVDKSQEILKENFRNLNRYYIWDCACGEGNLLEGLEMDKDRIFASTLEAEDVEIIKSKNISNNVFQFDFLNDDFSKLPEKLKTIIAVKELREKLIIFINPPYGEAQTILRSEKTSNDMIGIQNTKFYEKHANNYRLMLRELYAQFVMRIYWEIPGAYIGFFSTLKCLISKNMCDFRNSFLAELLGGFVCQGKTFYNVNSGIAIIFTLWNTKVKNKFFRCRLKGYDKDGNLLGYKQITSPDDRKTIKELMSENRDNDGEKLFNLASKGCDISNADMLTWIYNYTEGDELLKQNVPPIIITPNNFRLEITCFGIRKCVKEKFFNGKNVHFCSDMKWTKDEELFSDSVILAIFDNVIKETTNHPLIPYYEKELGLEETFGSHFLQDYISGKLKKKTVYGSETFTIHFSEEGKKALEIGKELFTYYHSFPDTILNAGIYEIKEFFKGRNEKGRLNTKTKDAKAKKLFDDLSAVISTIKNKIEQKEYDYGIMEEDLIDVE